MTEISKEAKLHNAPAAWAHATGKTTTKPVEADKKNPHQTKQKKKKMSENI